MNFGGGGGCVWAEQDGAGRHMGREGEAAGVAVKGKSGMPREIRSRMAEWSNKPWHEQRRRVVVGRCQ
jgi:hypothetical protein